MAHTMFRAKKSYGTWARRWLMDKLPANPKSLTGFESIPHRFQQSILLLHNGEHQFGIDYFVWTWVRWAQVCFVSVGVSPLWFGGPQSGGRESEINLNGYMYLCFTQYEFRETPALIPVKSINCELFPCCAKIATSRSARNAFVNWNASIRWTVMYAASFIVSIVFYGLKLFV
jgi:hypothetical protein